MTGRTWKGVFVEISIISSKAARGILPYFPWDPALYSGSVVTEIQRKHFRDSMRCSGT